ncbi:MAG TPA: hypothetical protein VHY84_21720 [Bryobacteraceae bacterium]|jgi:heme A synthase|nr:hypothetical protein [Bryobacteraceae bacterium]
MTNPWAHRCAVLLALCISAVIVLGACLTSEIRTFPGAATPSTVTAPVMKEAHVTAGLALILITCVLAWFMASSNKPLLGVIGVSAILEIASISVPIAHALISPIFFSVVVVTAVVTSKSWQTGPTPVESPWGPLRPLGIAVPVFVLIQIALGASFRHNAMGVVWHILDAFIVLLVALVAGVFVLRQYPDHPALRPAALALVIFTGVQVLLGFAVYMVLLISSENNMGLIVTGVLHVTNGALTFAASVVLAMQMRRNLIQSGV